jgi:hypothetical protein
VLARAPSKRLVRSIAQLVIDLMSILADAMKNRERNRNALSKVGFLLVGLFPLMDIFLFRKLFILFPGPLGYGPFLCMYALLPFLVARHKAPLKVGSILLLIGLIGSSGWLSGDVELPLFIKSFGSLVLPYCYYWYLWQHYDLDVTKAFRWYLKGATLVSMFGLVLFADSLVGLGLFQFLSQIFNLGREIPAFWGNRVIGTLGEPTYFANVIAPAVFFAIGRLFFAEPALSKEFEFSHIQLSKSAAAGILTAQILTFSTIAYAGILLSFGFLFFFQRRIRSLLVFGVVAIALMQTALSIPEIETRISGLSEIGVEEDINVHGSSAVLYNHAVISWENFKQHPWIGSGLGSHTAATKKHTILRDTPLHAYAEQNAADASSMFLRIASELGLFGIMLCLLFLWKNHISVPLNDPGKLVLKHIHTAFLVTILLQLFRQGNFILNGFPFFAFGLYLSRIQFQKNEGKETM